MTPEMVEKARENAKKNEIRNVEFSLGEIEDLPIADDLVDVVISNCVINLSADKPRVFHEIYRVLKPGGRIAISDTALLKDIPQKIRDNIDMYVSCIGGAILVDEYKKIVEASGLKGVKVTFRDSSYVDPNTIAQIGRDSSDGLGEDESLEGYVINIFVEGYK